MIDSGIYGDIAKRTDGAFYIGVVGPVRTGKSTFIKKFMETAILPQIADERERGRAQDEMPQSAGGRTIMTCEPKFIPEQATEIKSGNVKLKVRMVDCVGFLVDGALGQNEEGAPRFVRTPWTDQPIPFAEAAELGTKKVIAEHSSVAFMVTTDGSVADLNRQAYVEAERKTVQELKKSGVPFVIILNSATPQSSDAEVLALSLEKEYEAPVALVNCLELDETDVSHVLGMILGEFPAGDVTLSLPEWTDALENDHKIIKELKNAVLKLADKAEKVSELRDAAKELEKCDCVCSADVVFTDLSSGESEIRAELKRELYYAAVSEKSGLEVESDADLLEKLCALSENAAAYKRLENALSDVNEKGYGIVMPEIKELRLEEPEIIKGSGGYGVKLKASARSIHLIRADIETEINPIVGTEQQSQELVRSLLEELQSDPDAIWQSNMFGKSLYELVNEGLHNKLEHMPQESRAKLSETLGRIINEGSGGLICIIL